jgi:hypothetical protein
MFWSDGYGGYTVALQVTGGLERAEILLVRSAGSPSQLDRRKKRISATDYRRLAAKVAALLDVPSRPMSAEPSDVIDSDAVSLAPVCLHAAEVAVEQWSGNTIKRRIFNACDEHAVVVGLVEVSRDAATKVDYCRSPTDSAAFCRWTSD